MITFRYHLGSIAFGSLIIAIVRFIRYLLTELDRKLKQSQLGFARFLLKYVLYYVSMAEEPLIPLSRSFFSSERKSIIQSWISGRKVQGKIAKVKVLMLHPFTAQNRRAFIPYSTKLRIYSTPSSCPVYGQVQSRAPHLYNNHHTVWATHVNLTRTNTSMSIPDEPAVAVKVN